jgi:hypothetical protein
MVDVGWAVVRQPFDGRTRLSRSEASLDRGEHHITRDVAIMSASSRFSTDVAYRLWQFSAKVHVTASDRHIRTRSLLSISGHCSGQRRRVHYSNDASHSRELDRARRSCMTTTTPGPTAILKPDMAIWHPNVYAAVQISVSFLYSSFQQNRSNSCH